jgi:RimJ/RimL family protein N-acetyltransferase
MRAEADLVRIRPARPYDAAALLELKRQLDRETAFMMYEPGERDSAVQDLAAELAGLGRCANSVVLLAERADQVIGYVQLTGGTLRRSRATAYLAIGVLNHAAGRGTGTELLRQAQAWAAARGLHRLELTVMAHNTRAIRLYERTGFTVEGRRSECLLVDGQFIDELTMALLLPVPPATPLTSSATPLPFVPPPPPVRQHPPPVRQHPPPVRPHPRHASAPDGPVRRRRAPAMFLRALCATDSPIRTRSSLTRRFAGSPICPFPFHDQLIVGLYPPYKGCFGPRCRIL